MHTGGCIARINRARITVVDGGRYSGEAGAGTVAGLEAIAGIAIGARGAGRNWVVMNACCSVTTVDGARVSVVDGWRYATDTDARAIAGFEAIASVAVGA